YSDIEINLTTNGTYIEIVNYSIFNSTYRYDDNLTYTGSEYYDLFDISTVSNGEYNITTETIIAENCQIINETNFSITEIPTIVNISLYNPAEDLNVSRLIPFNFTVNVTCEQGYCENTNVSLDPVSRKIYFEKYDYGTEEDCITDNVCITRGDRFQIYNSVTEDIGDAWDAGISPEDTLWAVGTCDSPGAFQTFVDAVAWNPPANLNQDMCMRLVTDGIDLDIVFVKWTSGWNGGGFAYYREGLPGEAKESLVNTTEGATPFWTSDSNPQIISLTAGQSELVSFNVTPTGDVNRMHEFFAFANGSSAETERINITIIAPQISMATIEPTADTSAPQQGTFTYSARVTCGSGYCGYVNVTLDPTAPEQEWNYSVYSINNVDRGHLIATSDGSLVGTSNRWTPNAGYSYGLHIYKINENGTKDWQRVHSSYEDQGDGLIETNDDGFMIFGETYVSGGQRTDPFLVKTDKDGYEEWNRTFAFSTGYDYGTSIIQNQDNTYIMAGWIQTGAFPAFIIKTDSNGNELWNKTYDGTGSTRIYDIKPTSDGGYIATGESNSDIWVMKVDSSGESLWNYTYYGSRGYQIIGAHDTGYIIAGDPQNRLGLIKIDDNGNELWNKTYALNKAFSVTRTWDQGYAILGDVSSDWFVVKTDIDGNETWNYTIEDTLYVAYSIVEMSDRSLAFSGAGDGIGDTVDFIFKLQNGLNKSDIPTTIGATPFYTNVNPYQCGEMSQGDVCDATFTVTTTGNINETYMFFAYGESTQQLDVDLQTENIFITITESTAAEPTDTSTGGTGTTITDGCIENWFCEEWPTEECPPSGQYTRTCTDINECGTINNRPATTRSCIYIGEEIIEEVEEEGVIAVETPEAAWIYMTNLTEEPIEIKPDVDGIERITVRCAKAAKEVSEVLRIKEAPLSASAFTDFDYLFGVEPNTELECEIDIETEWLCIGEEYNLYKCVDWDFNASKCRDDFAWEPLIQMRPGLQKYTFTLKPGDPGLGIGPSPIRHFCGDNMCDLDESCSSCSLDCGACSVVEQPTSVLTRILGFFRSITGLAVEGCEEAWWCRDWGPWNEQGYRTRKCGDINECGTTLTKPKVTDYCEYIEQGCSNGLKDQTETGIDCGGVCDPCIRVPLRNLWWIILVIIIVTTSVLRWYVVRNGGWKKFKRKAKKYFLGR
ncbi:hypothetical protein KY328_03260, partial [Candidatus Woesearchaeota archaeon]|nr:hypothetical protein [Candidatus Woesearchaeota archaeon]